MDQRCKASFTDLLWLHCQKCFRGCYYSPRQTVTCYISSYEDLCVPTKTLCMYNNNKPMLTKKKSGNVFRTRRRPFFFKLCLCSGHHSKPPPYTVVTHQLAKDLNVFYCSSEVLTCVLGDHKWTSPSPSLSTCHQHASPHVQYLKWPLWIGFFLQESGNFLHKIKPLVMFCCICKSVYCE